MEEQILSEISELRKVLTYLIGTSNLSSDKQFSTEALDKAAKEFRTLTSLKDQWLRENDLYDIFPGCWCGTGKFIRDQFEFSNYFTRSNTFFYNKKDIMALSAELKARKIDLAEYMKLTKDQVQLRKKIETAVIRKKQKKSSFNLPDGYNVITSAKRESDNF